MVLEVIERLIGETLRFSRVLRVNPGSGARTVVSDVSTKDSASSFGTLRGIAVEATGQLVVMDSVQSMEGFLLRAQVVRVDPSSGSRTIVSDTATGGGPPFGALAGIAVETTGQLVVVDERRRSGLGRVLRVDPGSGVRTIVFDATIGSGPSFDSLRSIAVEATGQLVVAQDIVISELPILTMAQVLRVDPGSGVRTIVSDATIGSGPSFDSLRSIAVEATGQLVVVDEGALDRVLRVDPRSGARTIVTEAPFVFIVSIAVEATGQLVAANENFPMGVLRVDPSSGVRTVVSDMTTGSGPPFGLPRSVAVEATGQLVVVESDELSRGRIMRVDPSSGARTIVSGATTGNGPSFDDPLGLVVEATGQLVVLESQRVLRVDSSSGARTIIADATRH